MVRFKDMVDIRETLKKLRAMKGVTVTQLCKETGISRSTYNTYEKDGRFPQQDTLVVLANYFECSVDMLVRGYETSHYHLAKAMHHFHHYFLQVKKEPVAEEDDEKPCPTS